MLDVVDFAREDLKDANGVKGRRRMEREENEGVIEEGCWKLSLKTVSFV